MFQSSALLVWTSLPHAVVFYVWNVRRCQQQGAFLGLTAAVSWAPPADRPWARCFLYSILFNAHRAPRAWTLRLQEVTPPVRDLPQSWRWPLPAATCWAEEGLLCTWATNLGHRSLLGDKESHPPSPVRACKSPTRASVAQATWVCVSSSAYKMCVAGSVVLSMSMGQRVGHKGQEEPRTGAWPGLAP